MSKITPAEVCGVLIGCGLVVLMFAAFFAVGFVISAGLIYLLMNVLLPVLGVAYPLTWFQCFVAAFAISIVSAFVRSMLRVVVRK